MSKSLNATKSHITLKGSAAIVSEFFGYSINSILYQRGIYDSENFTVASKYGLKLYVSADKELQDYLKNILGQLSEWLQMGVVKQLVLVISSVDNKEVLERWVFKVETDEEVVKDGLSREKEQHKISKEIAAVLRQITSSVSFLPLLDEPCSFDLLVYTHNTAETPTLWEESDPRYINQSNEVRLRSFTTKIHQVSTSVAYKFSDDL